MTTPNTNPGASEASQTSRLADVALSSSYEARLKKWAREMREWRHQFEDWGERVRRDIIRLEEKTGIAQGDPGPPPPPPPPPEE